MANIYGNGTTTASAGANTITHFYDKAGVKAANAVNVYQQFASKKSMPQKMGKTFKISKFLHMYDRTLSDGDFAAKGYMTSRTLAEVNAKIAAAALSEGVGVHNEGTIQKITMEGTLARYGKMISYTDEVDLFSEDTIQTRYREELGADIGVLNEDLIQRDMLATTTKMYAGYATSMDTLGTDIAPDGTEDAEFKVSYDLIRKGVKTLVRNRAKKTSTIVSGSTKVGTTPIDSAFYAIINTDVKSDLETLLRGSDAATEYVFVPVHKYASANTKAEGEVGSMHEVRFIEAESAIIEGGAGALVRPWIGDVDGLPYATKALAVATGNSAATTQNAEYTGSLAFSGEQGTGADEVSGSELNDARFDVYPILFPTMDAFATIGLKGNERIKFNSKAPSSIELSNPYGTQGFFSANFWYASVILEVEKLLRIDVLASR
jgi:N4-gp56 family major capsid protein